MLALGVLDGVRLMRGIEITASVCALVLLSGCKKHPEPTPGSDPAAAPAMSTLPAIPANPQRPPPTAPSALPMGVTWEDPASWKRLAVANPMRKATYQVPRAAGDAEDGELAVFYFGPGEGGGIEANIERWTKQFGDVKPDAVHRSTRSANGLTQHTIEIDKGTFSSGMPGGPTQPKTEYGLLGGIVAAPSGAYFFKLTGPAKTVKGARETFYKLLDSVKTS